MQSLLDIVIFGLVMIIIAICVAAEFTRMARSRYRRLHPKPRKWGR